MLEIKNIVCPTDFSDPSKKALALAVDLAKKYDAQIHLLHVVSPVDPLFVPAPMPSGMATAAFDVDSYNRNMVEAARGRLQDLAQEVVAESTKTTIHTGKGKEADEIVSLAEELDADVIVIATYGHRGWTRRIFGTVTEKVIRGANCPVLSFSPEE